MNYIYIISIFVCSIYTYVIILKVWVRMIGGLVCKLHGGLVCKLHGGLVCKLHIT